MIKSLLTSKILVLLLISLSFTPVLLPRQASASHIMGGEITAAHLGGFDYELNLVLYRDVQGISIPQSVLFTVNHSGGSFVTASAQLDSSFLDTMTVGNALVGFEAAYYKLPMHTFPGAGLYNISWNSCCRNSAINNCMNPGSQSMHIETLLTIPSTTSNSTPVYLAAPVVYVQIDSILQHNPMPFDVDGDSLIWSIDTPWTNANINVPGWTTPSAHPGGAFSINSVNGEITWTPNTLGGYIASVIVEEYRTGVKIGEIRRDMQFIVVNDTSLTSPRIGNFNTLPTDINGNAKIIIPPGSAYSLNLTATNLQTNIINFTSYGEPYLLLNNPATFSVSSTNPGQATGTFNWTPNVTQSRLAPYLVSFRVSSGLFATDETLLIEVGNFTSVESNDAGTIGNSFPNPTQNIFFVPFELQKAGAVQFELFDMLGNKVAENVNKNYPAGKHKEIFDMDLTPGIYFMRISVDGKILSTKKIEMND